MEPRMGRIVPRDLRRRNGPMSKPADQPFDTATVAGTSAGLCPLCGVNPALVQPEGLPQPREQGRPTACDVVPGEAEYDVSPELKPVRPLAVGAECGPVGVKLPTVVLGDDMVARPGEINLVGADVHVRARLRKPRLTNDPQ